MSVSEPGVLDAILNYRAFDARISLSGQPTEAQFATLAHSGVAHVINLGPYDNDGALVDEPGTLAALGLGYTYIPVDFSAPSEADWVRFCEAMTAVQHARLHVHCIYNARVSAFMRRYAAEGRGGDEKHAAQLMESIWRPSNVWAAFLGDPDPPSTPHAYKGYDY